MGSGRRAVAAAVTLAVLTAGLAVAGAGSAAAEPQSNPDRPSVRCGGQWRWVHDELPEGVESGVLTAVYGDGATRVVGGELLDGEIHYVDFIAEPASLVDAADDVDGGRLTLVEWPFCDDRETTTSAVPKTTAPPETTTTAVETTTTAVETTTTESSAPATTAAPAGPGSLVVTVETRPADRKAVFQVVVYDADQPDIRWVATLGGGESFTVAGLAPDVYRVEQFLPPPGPSGVWEQEAAVCSGEASPVAVEIGPGDTVGCVFTNRLLDWEPTTTTVAASPSTTAPASPASLPFTGWSPSVAGPLALLATSMGASTVWIFRRRGRHER